MKKPFRFAVISDTHFFAPGKGVDGTWWNKVLGSQSQRIAESLIETVTAMSPDFIIHCGDLTEDSTMGSYNFGVGVMQRMGCPWYVVPGNHDTWAAGVRCAFRSKYSLETEECYYAQLINDVLFVFLDACSWVDNDGVIAPYLDWVRYDAGEIKSLSYTRDQLHWLDNQLAVNSDKPAILVSHTPLKHKDHYQVGTLPYGKPADGPWSGLTDAALSGDILDIVRKHANVKMALAGHWHINDVTVDRNTVYCMTSALREYPFEFRLVEVGETDMSVSTHGLNDKGLNEESFIKDWGNDWVKGTQVDREFSITL